MQTKAEIYAEKIQPMVQLINEICQRESVPMLMVFCLDYKDVPEDKKEMVLAGAAHLSKNESIVPQPMILAATMLRVPGFSTIPEADETDAVH